MGNVANIVVIAFTFRVIFQLPIFHFEYLEARLHFFPLIRPAVVWCRIHCWAR